MDPLTAEVANAVTRSNLKLVPNAKGEVDMCVAITGIREDGKIEGENKILTLMQRLFAAGRIEDAQKVSLDEEYRAKLLKEFGIED